MNNEQKVKENLRTDLGRRSFAAACAYKLAKKFPQIEQDVLAPCLMREAGIAFLAFIERAVEAEERAEKWRVLNQLRLLALESVEWIMVNGRVQCPSCLHSQEEGHGILCEVDEALRPTAEKLKLRDEQNAMYVECRRGTCSREP